MLIWKCDYTVKNVERIALRAGPKPYLTEGGDTLPDEERIAAESRIRWAAGAMDGVMGGMPDRQ